MPGPCRDPKPIGVSIGDFLLRAVGWVAVHAEVEYQDHLFAIAVASKRDLRSASSTGLNSTGRARSLLRCDSADIFSAVPPDPTLSVTISVPSSCAWRASGGYGGNCSLSAQYEFVASLEGSGSALAGGFCCPVAGTSTTRLNSAALHFASIFSSRLFVPNEKRPYRNCRTPARNRTTYDWTVCRQRAQKCRCRSPKHSTTSSLPLPGRISCFSNTQVCA